MSKSQSLILLQIQSLHREWSETIMDSLLNGRSLLLFETWSLNCLITALKTKGTVVRHSSSSRAVLPLCVFHAPSLDTFCCLSCSHPFSSHHFCSQIHVHNAVSSTHSSLPALFWYSCNWVYEC